MKTIIEVKGLSKKYPLKHNPVIAYSTIVESLTNKAKQAVNFFKMRSKPSEKRQEDFWALQDVDLKIEEGDRVGLIGRNGAGKSTLLKVLSRITEPTKGSVTINGRVSSLLEVGTGFHPELTGRENIYLNGAILGMSSREIKSKFDEIVSFAEVEKFLDLPVKRYSSGMYMRLGFAIAAHLDPDVFIIDEVLAVGDAQFQEKCIKKLNNLSHSGRTIIFVSHNIGSLLSICNKGIVLDKGRSIASGPIQECMSVYMQSVKSHHRSWNGIFEDSHIHFHSVSLGSSFHTKEFFTPEDICQLEIEYEIVQPIRDLVIGFGVWNQRQQVVARSYTCDDMEKHIETVQPGKYSARFNINPAMFTEGDYLIKIECFIHPTRHVLNDEIVLKFPVFHQQKNTRLNAAIREGIFLGNGWNIKKSEVKRALLHK